jgi:hypothetical protein
MSSSNENLSKFGKFNLTTVNKDTMSNHYVSDDSTYVCLIPFERTDDDHIKTMYLLQFPDHATGAKQHCLITDQINPDLDQTSYDSVRRAMIEEAGVNLDDLRLDENVIFYLGEIGMCFPVNAKMICYGIDLTGLKDPVEFTRILAKDQFIKDNSSIVKVGFHQVVNGDYSDSTVLSGAFLLVSYFN